jgi:hypothetical protein
MLFIGAMAAAVLAQVTAPTPPPLTRPTSEARPSGLESRYGSAEAVELEQVAFNGQTYHRRNVRVRGILGDLVPGQYLSLADGPARVMLIPLDVSDLQDFMLLFGVDVEVTGIARVLPIQQRTVTCRGESLPESLCDDPELPVLPNARHDWPSMSITILKIVDRGTGGARKSGPPSLADTGIEAAAAEGKPITAIGQFRGANLCRDLPDAGRRDARDWVLLTSQGPVWVTGRPPEGRGFRLDPAYRGDVNRWLEVTGRVSLVGDVRFLRAGKVALISRPPEAEHVPCAP